jgi:hypothetical protein
MKPWIWWGMIAAIAAFRPGAAGAHEFIVKPAKMTAAAGADLLVAALSSHVFVTSQELEIAKDVKIGVFANGKRIDVPVKPNDKALSYDGVVKAPTASTFIVTGERLAQIWATTPEGVKQATRKTPGASNPYKI